MLRRLRNSLNPRIPIGLLCLAAVIFLLRVAGSFLVVNDCAKSDLAVVLDGGVDDNRLRKGIELLRTGYATELILDESTDVMFGRPEFEYAADYVRTLPPEIGAHVHVCAFTGDATRIELLAIWPCTRSIAPNASKVLLVTSDFHSRRARSIARRLFPQCTWRVAGVADRRFGAGWWRQREWAKTCLTEWQKLAWWYLFERWHAK